MFTIVEQYIQCKNLVFWFMMTTRPPKASLFGTQVECLHFFWLIILHQQVTCLLKMMHVEFNLASSQRYTTVYVWGVVSSCRGNALNCSCIMWSWLGI